MEPPHCEANNATDARSEHQYSSPLQKEIQPAWDMANPLTPFELPCKETCSYVWWSQEATVVPPAPSPGCSWKERCQNIGLCASLLWFYLFPVY